MRLVLMVFTTVIYNCLNAQSDRACKTNLQIDAYLEIYRQGGDSNLLRHKTDSSVRFIDTANVCIATSMMLAKGLRVAQTDYTSLGLPSLLKI